MTTTEKTIDQLKEYIGQLEDENTQFRNREAVRLTKYGVIYCSLCPKSNKDVKFMISGMYGNICNVCLDRCIGIKNAEKP
jgi:hypothetical protein